MCRGDTGYSLLFGSQQGYTGSMVHVILDVGDEFDLRLAGENRFNEWLNGMNQRLAISS